MAVSNPRGTDISKAKLKYRERNEGDFPEFLNVKMAKEGDLKYGENPAQHGAIYHLEIISDKYARDIPFLTNLRYVRSDDHGKGGLSLTNTMDITRAMDNLKYFSMPAIAIMKHNIVSGFAKQTKQEQTLDGIFRLARDADLRSNFGGTVTFNRQLDKAAAEALFELKGQNPFFVDVLAAPGYEEGVLGYIEGQSKNIRIAEFSGIDKLPKFQGDDPKGLLSFKEMPTGRIGVQDVYLTSIKSAQDLILDPMVVDKEGIRHTIERDPTQRELDDLLTAWYLNVAGARSNGIVFVKDGVSVAIGSGQVERVGAVEQAIIKGMQKAMDRNSIKYDPLFGISNYLELKENPFINAVCSSDAFFPFPDSIETLARVGVTAVVQPYGSNKDAEVIDAANKHNIAMPATLERCFGHF
jgi:phosphoribosylaminoimidazolecarboxamide formyltransferase/IMP cyclohydrolase